MTNTDRITQITLCNGLAQEQNRIIRWNMIPYCMVDWKPIHNIFIVDQSMIFVEKFIGFMYVTFDYEKYSSPFAVNKVSERDTTTHFDEQYSLN